MKLHNLLIISATLKTNLLQTLVQPETEEEIEEANIKSFPQMMMKAWKIKIQKEQISLEVVSWEEEIVRVMIKGHSHQLDVVEQDRTAEVDN